MSNRSDPSIGMGLELETETDTLMFFPSWLRHEVLLVRVPSGAWVDSRFTVNCRIHRVNPAGAPPVS